MRVDFRGFAYKCLEVGGINLFALVDVDRPTRIAFETRIEEPLRVFEGGPLRESQLYPFFIGFAGAKNAVMRPNGDASPLPFFENIRYRLVDGVSHFPECFASPVVELLDAFIDQLRCIQIRMMLCVFRHTHTVPSQRGQGMTQIKTFLTFNHQAEEAAKFYTSVFPGSEITRIARYPDLGPESPFEAGSVMTVEFTLNGRDFVALNGCPQFGFSQGISIVVICDTQEQVDEYWARFEKAGGTPVACGWITDHFGVSWQIDPRSLIELISGEDEQRAAKAMKAMMSMVKIDSQKLSQAVND